VGRIKVTPVFVLYSYHSPSHRQAVHRAPTAAPGAAFFGASAATMSSVPRRVIDPWLKTAAFCNRQKKIAACHYYAIHPQSCHGEGLISSDFVGLARNRRQARDANPSHPANSENRHVLTTIRPGVRLR